MLDDAVARGQLNEKISLKRHPGAFTSANASFAALPSQTTQNEEWQFV